jgi:hypothetical protein
MYSTSYYVCELTVYFISRGGCQCNVQMQIYDSSPQGSNPVCSTNVGASGFEKVIWPVVLGPMVRYIMQEIE